DATVRRQLTPLGFETSVESPGVHQVRVPTFRPDSTREVDLIEEVARLNGNSKIPRTVPAPPGVGRLTPYQRDRRRVRQVLTGAGANEAWTASLLPPEDDARSAVDVWRALAAAVRLEPLSIEPDSRPGLHPTRSARLVVPATGAELGGLGEVDPDVLDAFGLGGRGGRVGWIEVDLGLL